MGAFLTGFLLSKFELSVTTVRLQHSLIIAWYALGIASGILLVPSVHLKSERCALPWIVWASVTLIWSFVNFVAEMLIWVRERTIELIEG